MEEKDEYENALNHGKILQDENQTQEKKEKENV